MCLFKLLTIISHRFEWHETEEYDSCDARCGQKGKQSAILVCQSVVRRDSGDVFEIAEKWMCDQVDRPAGKTRECIGNPCTGKGCVDYRCFDSIYSISGVSHWIQNMNLVCICESFP